MAATPDFKKPDWNNPIDTDLDSIRDTANFLLSLAVAGSQVAPGWLSVVDISTNNNYAQPDTIIMSKGSREIRVNMIWL
jgi:hypothetical protein